jgi:protein involved in polysaccharide export with SLBB domain
MPRLSSTDHPIDPSRKSSPFKPLALVVAGTALIMALQSCKGGGASLGPVPPPAFDPAAPRAQAPSGREVPIALGDQLELIVREDASINGTYQVREGGHIMLGRYGRVQLVGLNPPQAESKVKAMLETDQLATATVLIDRLNPRVVKDPVQEAEKMLVYMTGSVQRPGQHVLAVPQDRQLGVYEAILISGGTGRFANRRQAHILRADTENRRHKIPIDLTAIEQGLIPDPPIGRGDIVVVPEKVFGF